MLLAFDPDSFSQLQRCIRDETPSPSLKNILALIRLSRFESEVFYKFKQVLVDHIPYASDRLQSDFKSDILHIAANFYPLSASKVGLAERVERRMWTSIWGDCRWGCAIMRRAFGCSRRASSCAESIM